MQFEHLFFSLHMRFECTTALNDGRVEKPLHNPEFSLEALSVMTAHKHFRSADFLLKVFITRDRDPGPHA